MSKKAISYEERAEAVRRAIYRAGASTYDDYWYVELVYDGYAIVRSDAGEYLRVDYTDTADGITVTPRESWQPVEKEWAAKSTLVAPGRAALKALGNGKVGGHLVVFSDEDSLDLYGDFFDASTDFDIEDGQKTAIYYNHGLDPELKRRKIGTGTLVKDDVGIWLEAQLEMRDEYEKAIYGMVEAGKCGLSSGTAAHLVERNVSAKGAHITYWPLGLDASITPTPAEPRTSVLPLKSYAETVPALQATAQEVGQTSQDATATEASPAVSSTPVTTPEDTTDMTPEEIKQLIADAIKAAAQPAPVETAAPDIATIVQDAVKSALESAPAVKTGGFVVPNLNFGTEDPAEQEIKAYDLYVRQGIVLPQFARKAALNTTSDSTGGYLVPQMYGDMVHAGLKETSVLRRAGATVLQVSGTDNYEEPVRIGSTAAVLTAEATAFDEVEPTLGNVVWNPYKYTRLVKASDEQLADSRVDVVSQVIIPDVIEAFDAAENAAFTTGTNSGQPQGVITGATLGKTAASATAVTMDEIIDLVHSVFYEYRGRPTAGFMMHDSIAAVVRKLKGSDGQYYWEQSTQVGDPDRLLGFPVYINNSMASAMTTGQKILLFGEFARFKIVDFAALEMKRLDELYSANGQVGFRWYKRFDANVTISAALKYLALL